MAASAAPPRRYPLVPVQVMTNDAVEDPRVQHQAGRTEAQWTSQKTDHQGQPHIAEPVSGETAERAARQRVEHRRHAEHEHRQTHDGPRVRTVCRPRAPKHRPQRGRDRPTAHAVHFSRWSPVIGLPLITAPLRVEAGVRRGPSACWSFLHDLALGRLESARPCTRRQPLRATAALGRSHRPSGKLPAPLPAVGPALRSPG